MTEYKELQEIAKNRLIDKKYFDDALSWYEEKYIYQLGYRALMIATSLISVIVMIVALINIYILFPMNKKVNYALILGENTVGITSVEIKVANEIESDAVGSVYAILIRNYVKFFEEYRELNFADASNYVRNNSTRLVYQKFLQNLEDLEYQKYKGKREIEITNVVIDRANSTAFVEFKSKGTDLYGKIVEDVLWRSSMAFESDDIGIKKSSFTPFLFTIYGYESKLLKDNTRN